MNFIYTANFYHNNNLRTLRDIYDNLRYATERIFSNVNCREICDKKNFMLAEWCFSHELS